MLIYYSESEGREDVDGGDPKETSLDTTLAIFRSLDESNGFLGLVIDEEFTLQFAPQGGDVIYAELLHQGSRQRYAGRVTKDFSEKLIMAAFNGRDIQQFVHAAGQVWENSSF